MRSGGIPSAALKAYVASSWPWVGAMMRQRWAFTSATQFMGSIVAWARKGFS